MIPYVIEFLIRKPFQRVVWVVFNPIVTLPNQRAFDRGIELCQSFVTTNHRWVSFSLSRRL